MHFERIAIKSLSSLVGVWVVALVDESAKYGMHKGDSVDDAAGAIAECERKWSWFGVFRIRQELPDQRVREMGIAHSGSARHEITK